LTEKRHPQTRGPLSTTNDGYACCFESDADTRAFIKAQSFSRNICDVRSECKTTVDDKLVYGSKIEYLSDCAVESVSRASDSRIEHHGNVFRSDSYNDPVAFFIVRDGFNRSAPDVCDYNPPF
jgi:hypothetical protein